MKITRVTATAVRIPAKRLAVYSRKVLPGFASTLIEIETDVGLTGVGETRGDWPARIINERFAPALAGCDALDRAAAFERCVPMYFDYGYPERTCDVCAFAGIELALWDLAAKAADAPVYQLLGGPVRQSAPFVAYSYAVDTQGSTPGTDPASIMAKRAEEAVQRTGARVFEFKVGRYPVATEVQVIRAVRQAVGPEVDLAIDGNAGFTIEAARRLLHGVADVRLSNVEEPVAGLDPIARLREEFGVPVSTHCYDPQTLRAYPAIDSVVSDIALHGGFAGVISIIEAVHAIGKRFWLRSRWETGIAWAAMVHLGMARTELDRPAQCLIDWIEDDLISGDPWLVRDGGVRAPDRPGLGVEIDRAALQRYAIATT